MLDIFNKLKASLQGKKTFLIVGLFLACVVAEKFLGVDVPYFAIGDDWLNQVAVMLGFGTVRAGINQVQK
jgi:hypothetical protein